MTIKRVLCPECLRQARADLIRIGLIAYQPPLYQVLALDTPPRVATGAPSTDRIDGRISQLRAALLRTR